MFLHNNCKRSVFPYITAFDFSFKQILFLKFCFFFLVPEMKQQLLALVDSFRMAWKIARSSLTKDGKYCFSNYH